MTESRRDVALLDALAVALEPPPAQPTAQGLFRLRVAVTAHYSLTGTRPDPAPGPGSGPGAGT